MTKITEFLANSRVSFEQINPRKDYIVSKQKQTGVLTEVGVNEDKVLEDKVFLNSEEQIFFFNIILL